jgi:SAM-dependent methyltransferase
MSATPTGSTWDGPAACPICRSEQFLDHAGRRDARCAECGALERQRALIRTTGTLLSDGDGRCALEIGPLNARVFGHFLRDRGWQYQSLDSSSRGNPLDPRSVEALDIEADARDLSALASDSLDLLLVQHVIEEIDEYEQALAEFGRVLSPTGLAILEIPFDPTLARSEPQAADHFGNVWRFGADLPGVVARHLGTVTVLDYREGQSAGRLLLCTRADHGPSVAGHPATRENPIVRENARSGDGAWWGRHAPVHTIEGYTSECSVRPGDRLELHISTRPAARYRISVHRLGWYGGAGGRTLATHPGPRSDLQGIAREPPPIGPGPEVGSAGWPVTDVIGVGADWTTGVYVARLWLTSGEHAGTSAYVPFVVRPPLGTQAAVLVQQPVTTAQAYNNTGGKSLYPSNSTDAQAAVKVSFDRPYAAWPAANLNARWPFVWDIQLLRYLERQGVDVAYTTDIDTHREPWTLVGPRVLMTSGHDEYWSGEMRAAFDAARDDGVSLACMGANTGYWQIRLEDGERTMVEYREAARDPEPDPAAKTVRFRDLVPARPEAALFGVQYQDGMTAPRQPPRDYAVVPEGAAHPWMSGTGLLPSATLSDLVGYEWDALVPGLEPPGHTVFFHYSCPELSDAHAVGHLNPSGALVFAAGSLQFAWGLDDWAREGHSEPRLQRFMDNVLAAMLS